MARPWRGRATRAPPLWTMFVDGMSIRRKPRLLPRWWKAVEGRSRVEQRQSRCFRSALDARGTPGPGERGVVFVQHALSRRVSGMLLAPPLVRLTRLGWRTNTTAGDGRTAAAFPGLPRGRRRGRHPSDEAGERADAVDPPRRKVTGGSPTFSDHTLGATFHRHTRSFAGHACRNRAAHGPRHRRLEHGLRSFVQRSVPGTRFQPAGGDRKPCGRQGSPPRGYRKYGRRRATPLFGSVFVTTLQNLGPNRDVALGLASGDSPWPTY